MSSFKDFYSNYEKIKKPKVEMTSEDKFYEAIGIKIESLDAFTAWLILNNKIKSYIIDGRTDRPKSVLEMPAHARILHLVNTLPGVKTLAEEFSKKWKNK